MLVQLKQNELVAAIKQYLINEGINLDGKVVDVSFTAGRKEAGIYADINIEDNSIPDFGFPKDEDGEAKDTPVLKLVQDLAEDQGNDASPEPESPAAEPAAEAQEEVKPKNSLFN